MKFYEVTRIDLKKKLENQLFMNMSFIENITVLDCTITFYKHINLCYAL